MTAVESTPLLSVKRPGCSPPATTFASVIGIDGPAGTGEVIRLPQAIGHRGYAAKYPENSMAAFRAAIEVGVHAVETDIHLSKDGVVVLSHDSTLKRCFGLKEKIADCDWSYLSTLKTTASPHEPMARLVDLLEYLAQPGLEEKWMLIDIKLDDDAHQLLSQMAAAIASVPSKRPWNQRIILGGWTAKYIKLCLDILPGFPIAFIGGSLSYAQELIPIPNLSFNILQQSLMGPGGAKFLRNVRHAGREVFGWTVNKEIWMEWCIRNELDGVISDDPKLFLDVCRRWQEEAAKGQLANLKRKHRFGTPGDYFEVFTSFFMIRLFSALIWWGAGSPREKVGEILTNINS